MAVGIRDIRLPESPLIRKPSVSTNFPVRASERRDKRIPLRQYQIIQPIDLFNGIGRRGQNRPCLVSEGMSRPADRGRIAWRLLMKRV